MLVLINFAYIAVKCAGHLFQLKHVEQNRLIKFLSFGSQTETLENARLFVGTIYYSAVEYFDWSACPHSPHNGDVCLVCEYEDAAL